MIADRRRAFAAAAESFLGCPFRLHGRDPDTGLDCVGLVLCGLKLAGLKSVAPAYYGLRNTNCEKQLAAIPASGFAPISEKPECGDLLVVHPGPAQWHLLVVTQGQQYVHAHAGLRKVVQSQLPTLWPIEQHWRLIARNENI